VENLIVSLTSYGPRFKFLNNVLSQIDAQTLKPTKTLLNIDIQEANIFKNYLHDLAKFPNLEVNYVENLGPGKKLIPALVRYPESCIITIDDDLRFRENLFSELWKSHLEYPSSIIATRTHSPRILGCGYLAPYKEWMSDVTTLTAPRIPMITAGSGALFPPNSLHQGAQNYEKYKEFCFSTDDVWYWFHALLNGSDILKIEDFEDLDYLKGSQLKTLYWDGNASIFNDFNIQNMALDLKVFECVNGCHPNNKEELLSNICEENSSAELVGRILPLTRSLSNLDRYFLIRDISRAEKSVKDERLLSQSNRKLIGAIIRNLTSRQS
jgi:hypothetical protein